MKVFAVLGLATVQHVFAVAPVEPFVLGWTSADKMSEVQAPPEARLRWHKELWAQAQRRRLATKPKTPSPTHEKKICQELMEKAVDGDPADEDDKLRKCYELDQGAENNCGTYSQKDMDKFCDTECSDVLADWYYERVKEGCMGEYAVCDSGQKPDVCGVCRAECDQTTDCCPTQKCATTPKDRNQKVCIPQSADADMCTPGHYPDPPEKVVGKFSSNLMCSKSSTASDKYEAGSYCVMMDLVTSSTSCAELEKMGCCGPTMIDAGKAWAHSMTNFEMELKQTFSDCMYLVDESYCVQVDMTKVTGKPSSSPRVGGFLALVVAVVVALL